MYCWSSNLITCPEGIHNFVGSKNVTQEKKQEDESGNLFPCQAACPVWEATPRASAALGWEAEGWRGVCLHPASISITELDWGKQKSFGGRQTGSQQCAHAASMIAGVLFYQETDPKTGRGGHGGVPRGRQPLPRWVFPSRLRRGSSKKNFPQVGVGKQVFVVLVQRGNDWPGAAVVCSV